MHDRGMLGPATRRQIFGPLPSSHGSLSFSADVVGLDAIAGWIMRFGRHADVIESPELRAELLRRANDIVALYRTDTA